VRRRNPRPPLRRGGISLSRLGWGRTTETLAQHNRHLGVAAAGAVKANFVLATRHPPTSPLPAFTGHPLQATSRSGRFAVVMDLVQAAVEWGGASELVVGAGGDDATVVEQDDAVGELDRAQAVRDEEGRAALGELFDGLADQGLVLDVHGAGGL